MGIMTLSEVGVDIKHGQTPVNHSWGRPHQAGLIADGQAVMQVHLGQELHALHHQPQSHTHTVQLSLTQGKK